MPTLYLRIPLLGWFLLVFTLLPCLATQRVFILKNEGEIVQYKIRDKQEEVKQVATYSDQEFPGIFPAASIAMKRGNILSVYDRQRLTPVLTFAGPAIVEQLDATTVVEPGDRAEVDTHGNLLIAIGEGR